MRLRVDYERIEIRRLSTESYTRCPESSLATNWVWYWLDENSMWQEYGDEGTVSLIVSWYTYNIYIRFKIEMQAKKMH